MFKVELGDNSIKIFVVPGRTPRRLSGACHDEAVAFRSLGHVESIGSLQIGGPLINAKELVFESRGM